MKKLVALLGIACLLVGIRLYDTGLVRIADRGVLTVFAATEYTPDLFLPTGADTYRIDLVGAENVQKIIKSANAEIKFTEMDGQLIYAFSHRIPRSEWAHGKKFNLMIFVKGENVAVGVPIIKGSY